MLSIVSNSKSITSAETFTFAEFCINLLFEEYPELKRNLDVTIFYEDGVNFGWHGECVFLGFDYSDELVFEIFIDKNLTYQEILITLSHELLHVWQFSTKKLEETEHEILWEGKPIDEGLTLPPYEIEAFAKEDYYVDLYAKEAL